MEAENPRGSAEHIQEQVVNVGRSKIKNILAGVQKEGLKHIGWSQRRDLKEPTGTESFA